MESKQVAALQRVAAFFDLNFHDVKAVADELMPLDDAAQRRLDNIEAEEAMPAAHRPQAAEAKKSSRSRRRKMSSREPEGSGETKAEDDLEDEIVASMVQAMSAEGGLMEVDAGALREQEIVAEVAARRSKKHASGAKRQREKSDAIFDTFDADKDGFMNFAELAALGTATGGELPEIAYGAICSEVGANAKKGVTRDELFMMYTDAAMGDVSRDFNLIFNK